MNPKKEENTVFVLQKTIRKLRIKVTKTSIKEYLLAHPHYPSLKSVCDALKKWGIEHYPLQLEINEIRELEPPFIAHLKISGGQFVFVEKNINNQVAYSAGDRNYRTESFEKFAEKLSGAVVVMEAGQNAGEKQYRENRQNEILDNNLLITGLIAILGFALFVLFNRIEQGQFYSGFMFRGFLSATLLGLIASVFLVLHEFKVHTSISDKLCGFSSKTDCDTVLASGASKLFGWINWADAGLVYFTGILLYLAGLQKSSLSLPALISLLSLPYPVFSIWYQAVKLKKWCPFCLIVQLSLVTGFIILFPALNLIDISGNDLLKLFTSVVIPGVIWLLYKRFFDYKNKYEQERYSLLEFKRNPDFFIHALKKDEYRSFVIDTESLVLGNPDAPVTITAFLSLYCNPCASAFKQLKPVLENCPEIQINAIFSVYNDDDTKNLINTLYWIHTVKGSQKTVDFLSEWYSLPKKDRKTILKGYSSGDFDLAQKISGKNNDLFKQYQVKGTPTVYVNGYKFPGYYKYSDLEFFIDELKELNRESKKQEAYVNSDEPLPACLPLVGLPLPCNPDNYREKRR